MLLKNHTYFMGSFSPDNMDTMGISFQIVTTTHEKEAYGGGDDDEEEKSVNDMVIDHRVNYYCLDLS